MSIGVTWGVAMGMKLFVACLTLTLASGASTAQSYNIKIKFSPDVGKTTVYKESESGTTTQLMGDGDGKTLREEKTTTGFERVFAETVLETGEKGRPTKWKRTYEKATAIENGKTTTRSLEGKTVLFEIKEGKVTATPQGDAKIEPKDLEWLRKTNKDIDQSEWIGFLPKKAVKVGETWKVESKEVGELLKESTRDAGVDLADGGADGVLSKVYEKDGKQFGVIDLTIKLTMKEPPDIKFDGPATLEMKASLDMALDGSTTSGSITMGSKMVMKAISEAGGKKITLAINMDSSAKSVRSAEK
jgi:hypothetical protein